jgi:hypothetical protein
MPKRSGIGDQALLTIFEAHLSFHFQFHNICFYLLIELHDARNGTINK